MKLLTKVINAEGFNRSRVSDLMADFINEVEGRNLVSHSLFDWAGGAGVSLAYTEDTAHPKCVECGSKGDVMLTTDTGMCKDHFRERCTGLADKPSMSHISGPSTLEVTYDPLGGNIVRDSEIKGYVARVIKDFVEFKGDMGVVVGSSKIVDGFSDAIKEGLIEPWHIQFNWDGFTS